MTPAYDDAATFYFWIGVAESLALDARAPKSRRVPQYNTVSKGFTFAVFASIIVVTF